MARYCASNFIYLFRGLMHYRKTKSVSLLTLLKMYWFPKVMAENSTVAKLFTMALYKHTFIGGM